MTNTIEDRMAGYAAYHQDGRNQATHFIGVPMVYYSPLIPMGWLSWEISGFTLTLGMIVFAAAIIWYFTLDFGLASLMLLISLPIVYACHLASQLPFYQSLTIFLTVNLLGWVIQLVGHVFEGRRPALVDNLLQALMAPLFLIAEVLFAMGMRKDLEAGVKERVAVWVFPNDKATATADA